MDSGMFRLSNRRTTGEPHIRNTAKEVVSENTKPAATHQTDGQPRVERASHDSFSLQESVFSSECTFSQIDFFGRKGWRSSYTAKDAAINLWQRENISTASDTLTSAEYLQKLLYDDNFSLTPTEEQLKQYITRLRTTEGNQTVDWSSLAREVMSFHTATHEYLQDSLNYLASRYVSVKDKLIRCCFAEELAAEGKKLRDICFTGVAEMVAHYTQKLQSNLSLSPAEVTDIKESVTTAFQLQIQRYEKLLPQVHQSVAKEYPEDHWLRRHDGFIAARLRETVDTEDAPSHCRYTIRDLAAIGQIVRFYQREVDGAKNGNRNEANLALNLSMADMKAEILISRGLVTDSMAALLRNIRSLSHSGVLDAADEYLSTISGSPQSTDQQNDKTPMNRTMFRSIYNTVMQAFQNNGSNAPQAIRAGVMYGQRVTAQESEQNPGVLRWGKPMADYWHNFYTTPGHGELSPLEQKVQRMLSQVGQSRTHNSTYQNYVNDWRGFLTVIDYQEDHSTHR